MHTPVPGKAPLNSCCSAASWRLRRWRWVGVWQPVPSGELHPDLQVERPPGERWRANLFITFHQRAFRLSPPPPHLQLHPSPTPNPLETAFSKEIVRGQTSSRAFRHRMDQSVHAARPFYPVSLSLAQYFSLASFLSDR